MRRNRSSVPAAFASAARQLEYALGESATTEAAFQKLYALADARQTSVLRELEALLGKGSAGERPDRHATLSAFPTLAWLLGQTADPDKSAAEFFQEYRRQQSFSGSTASVLWSEFAGFLAYLGGVLAILLVVIGQYGVFVLPNFRSLYRGFGAELPVLTAAVFGRGAPLLSLLVLFTIALFAVLGWFVFGLRRQLRRYAPMSAALEPIPLIGGVVRAYRDYLWLSYASLLRATGMPAGPALDLAATRIPSAPRPDWDRPPAGDAEVPRGAAIAGDLVLAARLGQLDAEAGFQQDASADAFLDALATCRRRARVLLTACVYFLVAAYVTAMYLPIFSLGSAL